MKYVITCLILVLFTAEAMAVDIVGKVSHLYSSKYDNVYFRIEGDTCKTEANGKFWYFPRGPVGDHSHHWYAMLLAAGTSGKPVKIQKPACVSHLNQQITGVRQDF